MSCALGFSGPGKNVWTLGFTLGNVVGMYLAQNYDNADHADFSSEENSDIFRKNYLTGRVIPNIAKKLEDFKKDVEAKKKPPSDKS